MLFNSTYPENLKKQLIKVVIGEIVLGEHHSNHDFFAFNNKINNFIQKAGVDNREIQFRTESFEVDEFGHQENKLVIFYKREETEKEYSERIEKLELKDLIDFVKALSSFNVSISQKKQIKSLYSKYCINRKYKGLAADWQKKQLEVFFNETNTQELIDAAYNDGVKKGKEIGKREFLDKLKE